MNRRQLLREAAAGGVLFASFSGARGRSAVAEKEPPAEAPKEWLKVPDHSLTVITGRPRERGRQYGRKFKDKIPVFLDQMIHSPLNHSAASREDLLHYAGKCEKEVKRYAPLIHEELEGVAEGSGIALEELVLLTLQEELYQGGVLPAMEHCTALAAGPPDTGDGSTYIGQTWDWQQRHYGLSSLLMWKRPEGPSLLAFSYPGLWVGAGLNAAGIALCWTSADGRLGIAGPRVGVPTYVVLTQMLYQETLEAAIAEARRATLAGWFTFLVADGRGQIGRVEGSPQELAVELGRGRLALSGGYQTRQMTRTRPKPLKLHPQCQRMNELLAGGKGRLDGNILKGFFGDHQTTICKHFPGNWTLDAMLFNCSTREAHVSRGPGCSNRWKRFDFDQA